MKNIEVPCIIHVYSYTIKTVTMSIMIRRNQVVRCVAVNLLSLAILIVLLDVENGLAYTTRNTVFHQTDQYRTVASLYQHDNWRTQRSIPTLSISQNEYDDSSRYDGLLLQLIEPFDRWRYLQKLLDEDINDASEILFILQTSVRQQLKLLEEQGSSSVPTLQLGVSSLPMNEIATNKDNERFLLIFS